ncbi:MAG: FHA domain-containing protein [Chloroflexi bacterium]|nr:FHA domain-containing protein [Chloroflexota bacterium]
MSGSQHDDTLPQQHTCPTCGVVVTPTMRVCKNCGELLPAATDPRYHTVEVPRPKIPLRSSVGTAHLKPHSKLTIQVDGSDDVIELPLKAEMTLGRSDPRTGETPDVPLDHFNAYQRGVSRLHALLVVTGNTVQIMDQGSANSTYLNGTMLTPNQPYAVHSGDEVCLGTLILTIHFEPLPEE